MRCVRATVTGRVQGVSFRWYTRAEARRLGVAGWARNLPDGSVEVVAQGTGAAIDVLLRYLQHGPPLAFVETVEIEEAPPLEAADFTIRH